jgi:sigma-B regulation protein RsbU (phosphoserine phosphatase)
VHLAAQSSASERQPFSPALVAAQLSSEFPWDPKTSQFFTLLYGILDLSTCQFRFVSAGHPAPVYLSRDGRPMILTIERHCPISVEDEHFKENCLSMKPGDRLFLYSDGVVEAMNSNADANEFGSERLMKVLGANRTGSLEDSLAALTQSLKEWCGNTPPHDDVSVLAIEITEPAVTNG